ncbi:DUF2249 domain-containing protein [Streptomyces sp. NPDC050534]|uniref:DUF2249 domain-containing protein n=1 Tax=Streptomyces sp. NPDC050534 TaxID=3365625 RepID=UPI00379E475E
MAPAAEVFIQATGTDPDVQARAVVEQAHERLLAGLAVLAQPREEPEESEESTAEFVEQLRRLLTATDQTLYAAASGAAETRLLVRSLRVAAVTVARHADVLATAADSAERAARACTLEGMLTVRFGVERAVLLPALTALPGVDPAVLVGDFGTMLEGGRPAEQAVVDVREIPHGRRHPRIFTRFARLAAGESFVLVNNHDPKPLRREFQATHPGRFGWEYVESGPERWQIRITRTGDDA